MFQDFKTVQGCKLELFFNFYENNVEQIPHDTQISHSYFYYYNLFLSRMNVQ